MKQKLPFSGIFAIVMVAMATLLITGCEQDEEYYSQSDEYTLADRMMTRAAEGGETIPKPHLDTVYYAGGSVSHTITVFDNFRLKYSVHWGEGYGYAIQPIVNGNAKCTFPCCCEPSEVTFSNAYILNGHITFTYSFTHHYYCPSGMSPRIWGDVITVSDTVALKTPPNID